MIKSALLLTILCMTYFSYAQDFPHPEQDYSISTNTEDQPCITAESYRIMDIQEQINRQKLGITQFQPKTTAAPSLQWPLKTHASFKDCDYYTISAFVDLDSTSGIKDWNCGTRTYNGHRGVDIVPWPFIWDKMDRNIMEVAAAAPGIILAKVDGNPDRICNGIGGGSNSNNYITIQHADGSTALYVHLKSGKFTSKKIGDSVVTGEYLGIVGSSGQSTGPHLHFEIRPFGTFNVYIDPFAGSCNTKIQASWWETQKPYNDPKILKLSLHTSWPYMGTCPITVDTTYEKDTFQSMNGQLATFYICSKHVKPNDMWDFKIRSSDNSILDRWGYTSTSSRNTSTLGWTKLLPTQAGNYIFEGTFNGITCTKSFTILSPLFAEKPAVSQEFGQFFPNPSEKEFSLILKNQRQEIQIFIYDVQGKIILKKDISGNENFSFSPPAQGMYFFTLIYNHAVYQHGKLICNSLSGN